MSFRDLLMRAYPRSWRNEYGREMIGILAGRRLTPSLIADVLASGVGQHLRRDPWKICALDLTLWALGLWIVGLSGLITYQTFLYLAIAGQLWLFAAGAWTGVSKNTGILSATVASAKAAILPATAGIVIAAINMLRYWTATNEIRGHTVYYWISKNVMVVIVSSLVAGFAGASFARLVLLLRRSVQRMA